jgi:hypothetical protein
MARTGRKLRPLARELARRFPDLDDPDLAVTTGVVLVDGLPNRNPASLVAPGAAITLDRPARCAARPSCDMPWARSPCA